MDGHDAVLGPDESCPHVSLSVQVMNADTFSFYSRAQIIGTAQSVASSGRLLLRFTTSSRRMRGEMMD